MSSDCKKSIMCLTYILMMAFVKNSWGHISLKNKQSGQGNFGSLWFREQRFYLHILSRSSF